MSLSDSARNDKGISSSDALTMSTHGLASPETLERYFIFYRDHLDPYIHHLLAEGDTLSNVQERSPLLLAAICTVVAFCTGRNDYQILFDTYMEGVSSKMFSSSSTFDDVRALCIGALWLDNVSTVLSTLGKILQL